MNIHTLFVCTHGVSLHVCVCASTSHVCKCHVHMQAHDHIYNLNHACMQVEERFLKEMREAQEHCPPTDHVWTTTDYYSSEE